jgi:hypothetical protein
LGEVGSALINIGPDQYRVSLFEDVHRGFAISHCSTPQLTTAIPLRRDALNQLVLSGIERWQNEFLHAFTALPSLHDSFTAICLALGWVFFNIDKPPIGGFAGEPGVIGVVLSNALFNRFGCMSDIISVKFGWE